MLRNTIFQAIYLWWVCLCQNATEDIKRGEVVLLNYGENPNKKFFKDYGFVNLGNEKNDSIVIKLERLVDKTDPFLAKKL